MATAVTPKPTPANSGNAANAANPVTGSASVAMPDQGGSFHLTVPRGAVKHVQVVDVDMVLEMTDGSKVVLAGGAMGAMDDKSKIVFADTAQDTGRMLDLVGKIPLQNHDQAQILNSDPNKSSAEGSGASDNHFATNNNSAQINTAATSQLAKIIQDNAGSLTSNGLQNLVLPSIPLPPSPSNNGADAQVKVVAVVVSEREGAVLTPIVVGPQTPAMSLNLVNLTTVTQVGSTLFGSGGSAASASDGSNVVQFASQVINAGNDVHTIYATSTTGQSDFIKIFQLNVTGDGTVKTVTITGVPSNLTILNAVNQGGGTYLLTANPGDKSFALQVQYTTTAADPTHPTAGTSIISFDTTVVTNDGPTHLLDSRSVVIKDASVYTDLIYLDPRNGSSVWVLPAQGTPHEIHAGDGGVTIYGSNANDLIYGGAGADTIIGGSGNTYFEGGAGADVLTGGTQGVNTAGYKNSGAGVTIDLTTGHGTGGDAQGDVLTNIQNLIGSAYNDTFVANDKINRLDGGSGGSDTVSYAASTTGVTVNLITGTGSGGYAEGDTYVNIQNVIGSAFSDVFIANTLANHLDGGSGGSDTVSYASSTAGVTVNLSTGVGSGGSAAGDTYTHVQNVIGSAYNDIFVANIDANSFDGGSGGLDTVSYVNSAAGVTVNFVSGRGVGGDAEGDTYNRIQNVIGSAHDDTFIAGPDSRNFDGGIGGSDTINYGASTAAVTVNMVTMSGSGGYAQNNTYANIQNATGSSYSDTFISSAGANHFDGGLAGSDTVSYALSNAGVTVSLYDGSASGGYAQGDTLAHIQNVIGSDYNDTFIASSEVNNFEGGLGVNTVSYFYATGSVMIDLTNTIGTGTGGSLYANGDSFSHIQNLIGGASDDTFIASSDANKLDGGISTSGSHNRISYAASTAGVTVDLNYTDGTGTSGGYAQGDQLLNVQDLTGSNFNDTFVANAANNNFDGGGGSNRVSYAMSNAAVTVDLVDGTGAGGYAAGDTYVNIQNVTGSALSDTFIASAVTNAFDGGAGGSDTVSYARASDGVGVTVNLVTGTGSNGFAANDTYTNIQNIIGSSYNDIFVASNDVNRFDGGGGSDTVSYASSGAAVTVDLVGGTGTGGSAQGDTYINIQNVIGSSADDLFIASTAANAFEGGISTATSHNRVSYVNSTVAETVNLSTGIGTGGLGSFANGDTYTNIQDVTGGSGDDIFVASSAANNFDGGVSVSGVDAHNRVSYVASDAAVTVDLTKADGTGTSGGFAQGDKFVNIQDLTGSQYDDTFIASSDANNFDGGVSVTGSHNRVSYASSTGAVTVDLSKTDGTGTSGGFAQGDKFINIQDVTGSQYNDTFVASSDANNFDGGTGTHNRVSYASSTAAVTVDLTKTDGTGTSGGFAQGDKLINVQDLIGSQYDDIFIASSDANNFDGGASVTGSHNRVSYAASAAGVTVDLNSTTGAGTSGGFAAGDTFVNIQDITGGSGNDTFVANGVANNFDGGIGSDTVSYSASTVSVTVNLSSGAAGVGGFAQGDTYTSIENVIGGTAGDTLTGATTGATVLTGGGGGDTLAGVASNRANTYASYATSAASSGTLGVTVDLNFTDGTGTSGADANGDKLSFIDNLIGSAFDDTFVANDQANSFDGGAGADTISYARSTSGVTVNLSNGSVGAGGYAQGDTYANIENITGSASADVLTGAGANKTVLTGLGGGDTLAGTAANHANTYASYAGSAAGVTVDLNYTDGTGTFGGDATGDKLSLIDNLIGSSFNDTFVANGQNNIFDGGAGGIDTVSYLASTGPVTVDLSNTAGTGTSGGYAAGDKFIGIANLIGSNFDDTFFASSAANAFNGSGHGTNGDTVSYARSNVGVLVDLFNHVGGDAVTGVTSFANGDTYTNIQNATGGGGNDIFVADGSLNRFDGGAGIDTVSYQYSNSGAITANLAAHVGTGGDAAGDTYANIENLTGSANVNSTLIGDTNANTLTALGTTNTNTLSGGGAATGTDIYNAQMGGNSVTVGSGLNTINVSAGS